MYAKRARPVPMAEPCTLMHFRLAASASARHARALAAILTHAGDAESIAAGNGDVGTATRRSDRGESLGNCCRAGCGREQAAIGANGQVCYVETMDFLFDFMLDGDELPVACVGPDRDEERRRRRRRELRRNLDHHSKQGDEAARIRGIRHLLPQMQPEQEEPWAR